MTATRLRHLITLFPWDDWSKTLQDQYAPLYDDMLQAGGSAGAKETGGAFAPDDPLVAEFSDHYIGERIKELTATTRDAVSALVERSIEEGREAQSGDTPFALGSRIRDLVREEFSGYERWRADRIARTESATVFNLGSAFAYHQAGVTEVEISDGGEGGCEECDAVDGEIWTLEEFMAEPTGHPNCRRSASPVVPDDASAEE